MEGVQITHVLDHLKGHSISTKKSTGEIGGVEKSAYQDTRNPRMEPSEKRVHFSGYADYRFGPVLRGNPRTV